MNKLMTTAVLLASLTTASAQEHTKTRQAKDPAAMEQHAQERAGAQTGTMVEELGLDKDQAAKVKAINEGFTTSLMQMRKEGLTEDARKEKSKALHQQHNADLKAVLTPEQFEKLQALGKAKRAERGEGMKEMDPAKMQEHAAQRAEKRTEAMTEELGLNDEQSAKVESINGTFTAGMAKLKQSGVDEDARKAQMKSLRETRDAELKSVLTAEQYSKMMEQRRAKRAEGMERHQEMKKHNETKKPHNE